MSTVILSAASPATPSLQELHKLLLAGLAARGETEVRTFELATMKLAYCQGEFDCWVKTPGVCRSLDGEQDIVRAVHDAENLVLLDTVTFGGHSFLLKRAQDRLICLLAPFFEKRAQLTHHTARYEHAAKMYALGWTAAPEAGETHTWNALADANALNMLAPRVGSVVVDDAHRGTWAQAIQDMLASTQVPGSGIRGRAELRTALEEAARAEPRSSKRIPVRSCAFLVGSAKPKGTSASEAMARSLAARLEHEGVASHFHFATDFVHDDEKARAAATAIAQSSLFFLVSPLYVDGLPALATHALELVARARTRSMPDAFLVALVNCGFPEPEQTRTAFRMVRHFAHHARYHWAGGLPLGGGGMVQPNRPLEEQFGPATHIKRAFDAAVPSLARGGDVPAQALEGMLEAPISDGAYRLMGDLGWRYQAFQKGVPQAALRARPLD